MLKRRVMLAWLCWGIVSGLGVAQVGGSISMEARRSIAGAELVSAVRGPGAGGIQMLRAAWKEAQGKDRQVLAGRLAQRLLESGRGEEAADVLAELSKIKGPLGDWARSQGEPQEKPGKAKQTQDPIASIIAKLDVTTSNRDPARHALQQLDILGSLANPYILEALPHLGPFGMKNGLQFLVRHADERTTEALVAFLRGELLTRDVKVYASEVAASLNRAPHSFQKLLAETLLSQFGGRYRFAALRAFIRVSAEDPGLLPRVFEAVDTMIQGDESSRQVALALLDTAELKGQSGALSRLVQLASDRGDRVSGGAAEAWIKACGPEGEETALMLWEKGGPGARSKLAQGLAQRSDLQWLRLAARTLEVASLRRSFLGMVPADAKIASSAVEEMLGSEDTRAWAVQNIRARRLKLKAGVLTRAARAAVYSRARQSRGTAALVGLLVERDPAAARALAEKVVSDGLDSDNFRIVSMVSAVADAPFIHSVAAEFLRLRRMGAQTMRASEPNREFVMTGLLRQSTRENFDDLMELATPPRGAVALRGGSQLPAAIRQALQSWFTTEEVPAALAAIRRVDASVASALFDLISAKLREEHIPAVMACLEEKKVLRARRASAGLSEEKLREGLVSALCSLHSPKANAVLRRLASQETQIGEQAWQYLMKVESEDHQSLILAALKRKVPSSGDLRLILRDPLSLSNGGIRKKILDGLHTWPKYLQASEQAIETWFGEVPAAEATDFAQQALPRWARRGEQEDRCVAILNALGRAQDPKRLPALSLGLKHTSRKVRLAALEQVTATFSLEAAPVLIAALKDPELSKQADDALERLSNYLEKRHQWEGWLRELNKHK